MLRYKQSGFTLIELAMVLVVLSVLIGAFLSSIGSRIDATRRAETEKQMAAIKNALYGYAMSQTPPHLPCPDCRSSAQCTAVSAANLKDGSEDRDATTGTCYTNIGNLPWKTLGLASGDPWGDRYTYWVSGWAADVDTSVTPNTGILLSTSPNPATSGKEPATIDTRVNGNLTTISNDAVAVIISQGKDGYGGLSVLNKANPAVPTANVDENSNVTGIINDGGTMIAPGFISRSPSRAGATTGGGEYDDMLTWISELELKGKMVEAGVLP